MRIARPTLHCSQEQLKISIRHRFGQQKVCLTNIATEDQLKVSLTYYVLVAESYGSYPRDGLQEGHHYSLGAYHSCLEISQSPDQTSPPFSSQYCHIGTLVLPQNMSDIIGSDNEEEIIYGYGDSRGMLKPLLPPFSNLLGFYPFQVSY